jgi:ribonuclease R
MSSTPGTRSDASARAARVPAAGRPLVALLERRGRFLVAEPLFAAGPAGTARAGAHSARTVVRPGSRAGGRARPGDIVLVSGGGRGSGARVERVIGRPDVARDVLEAMLLDRGMTRRFDARVEGEAERAAARVQTNGHARRDLRALATFTIDPLSARDYDDAISAELVEDGATRVWVHIADVAAHVPEGSLLDREARARATSVYVPGTVEPMLPHALSSDACSLLPGVDRAAVTVELEFDGARVRRAAFYRSLIRSDARLDYGRVDRVFAGSEAAAEPWGAPLALAREVAAALTREREQHGALVVDSAEPEFSFDDDGNVTSVAARSQTESHRVIEQLMIAANEAVADTLQRRGVPCLYRVHERPEPERVKRLIAQLVALDVPTPPVPDPLSSTQAAELMGAVSIQLERHLARTGHGRLALVSLLLRSLKQAYYSPQNLGHAGLRSSAYCHFTSPIRRYPDLVCHRALLSAVGGGERAPRADELAELGAWTSDRERDAMRTERDADDVARCFALSRLLRERGYEQPFAGEITGLISAGAFVAFSADGRTGQAPGVGAGEGAPPFEGMLPVRALRASGAGAGVGRADGGGRGGRGGRAGRAERPGRGGREGAAGRDWWELDELETALRGERSGIVLRLGDAVDVRVARVDQLRGRVDLEPAG